MQPSHFARFTHRRTWDLAMGRQWCLGGQLRLTSCRLIAALDIPRPTVVSPTGHARYRITRFTARSTPMSTYYVDPATKPADQLHFSELSTTRYRADLIPVVTIEYASFSDYSGSDVERSNHRVILADEKLAPHVIRLIGGHGSEGLAYIPTDPAHPEDATSVPEALRDTIAALDQYPVLDDEDASELERELVEAAWSDDGRSDFRRALTALLDGNDPDAEHEIPDDDIAAPELPWESFGSSPLTWGNAIDALWRRGADALNVNGGSGHTVETGGGVYFYINDWCAKAGGDAHYPRNKPIHAWLIALADLTRIVP